MVRIHLPPIRPKVGALSVTAAHVDEGFYSPIVETSYVDRFNSGVFTIRGNMLSYNPIRDRAEGSSSITFICQNDATLETREKATHKAMKVTLLVLGVFLIVGVTIYII